MCTCVHIYATYLTLKEYNLVILNIAEVKYDQITKRLGTGAIPPYGKVP